MNRKKGRSKRRFFWFAAFCLLLLAGAGVLGYDYYNQEDISERRYARAEKMLAEMKYAAAADHFRGIYEDYPDAPLTPRALFMSGELRHLYLDLPEKALLDFLLIEKNYPHTPYGETAQRRIAALYMERLEDYGRAIVAYQKLIDQEVAGSDRLQYRIGEAYFQLNNFEQARIEWESLIKSAPESSLIPEALYRIGVTWSLQGDHREAEEAFRRVMDQHPRTSYAQEARFALAAVYEEQERLAAALEILENLQGHYDNPQALEKRIEQVRERIARKKKAI